MELGDLLKGIHAIIIDYRAEKGYGNNEFAKMVDLAPTAFVPIEGEKLTERGKIKTVDLMTLLKIFNGYPDLRGRILDYILLNMNGNGTGVQQPVNNKETMKDDKGVFYQDLIEKNTEYHLIPKTVFAVLKNEIELIREMHFATVKYSKEAIDSKTVALIEKERSINQLEQHIKIKDAELKKKQDEINKLRSGRGGIKPKKT